MASRSLYSLIAVWIIILSYVYLIKKPASRRRVYLVDFACYKPPSTLMCSRQGILQVLSRTGKFSDEVLNMMKRAMNKAGLGDSTYLPREILNGNPLNPPLEAAREEAEMVIFGLIDELLEKTKVESMDIGILIVNCCLFNVSPSLSSMIVHRYKLREDVKSFNLTGMGCSAGLIAIGMANQLLQVEREQYALVVSTENLTQNCYLGKDTSKVTTNCIFRLGGAAILLSNRHSDRRSSKYQLIHTVHVNNASSDIAYNSIVQEEDAEGIIGVSIRKDLLVAAKGAITSNLIILGPLVLPMSEKIQYFKNLLLRRFFPCRGKTVDRYVPRFSKCCEHFFPHVGGKPVLDELQKILGFSDTLMEAPRMSLHRFGNTSSSSVWYELAYAEAKGRIEKGDRLWQMAFGSGFKCSSVIWRAMRTVGYQELNPWNDGIDDYPVNNLGAIEKFAPDDLLCFERPN